MFSELWVSVFSLLLCCNMSKSLLVMHTLVAAKRRKKRWHRDKTVFACRGAGEERQRASNFITATDRCALLFCPDRGSKETTSPAGYFSQLRHRSKKRLKTYRSALHSLSFLHGWNAICILLLPFNLSAPCILYDTHLSVSVQPLYCIGQYNKAGVQEWMPFVIFDTRSQEKISAATSGPISEQALVHNGYNNGSWT